ncbi:uncharacterized protein LOC131687268 [Topomyia yanbarensis]|uniref:uncharacterized protein LOC131687268 n=1 Tax=Topomyia yanbarensis TaxID=2498891 RepID=UPI00273A7941|nr:uncharacterized protein LOC131687268 [Topomyia yanbarensis]
MSNINILPIEVLTRVFDYLDLYERKCASATCKRWNSILHCARFQRQCRLALTHIFHDELTQLEKAVVKKCYHLRVVHYDDCEDSDDEDYDEDTQRESEKLFSIKYLFQKTPVQNLSDLLFGLGLNLESLILEVRYENCREIIGDCLGDIKNLKELVLLFKSGGNRTPELGLWKIRHDKIESLKVEMPSDSKPLSFIVPSVTSLELVNHCRWSSDTVNLYSRQLLCLKVRLRNIAELDILMPRIFPNLTNLEVRNPFEMSEQFASIRVPLDEEEEQRFIMGMPRLKRLLLEGKFTLLRMVTSLARCANTLEELVLEDQQIEYELLKTVEKLPKLKSLTISECKVLMVSDMLPTLQMPQLEHFKLLSYKSDIIFDKGLSAVKSLELTLWADKNYKILHKVCENLPCLERLKLLLYVKLSNTALRHVDKLEKLKSLEFRHAGPSLLAWKHCPVLVPLQKLAFRDCTMDQPTLLSTIKPFPALCELYFDKCIILYCSVTARHAVHDYVNADDVRLERSQDIITSNAFSKTTPVAVDDFNSKGKIISNGIYSIAV